MLRLALAAEPSPWHGALVALCATLPALKGEEVDAIRRLVEEGPPAQVISDPQHHRTKAFLSRMRQEEAAHAQAVVETVTGNAEALAALATAEDDADAARAARDAPQQHG